MTGEVIFMKNKSESNKAVKDTETIRTLTCTYLDNISIIEPVIIAKHSDAILSCNYCYIADFKRYYFMNRPMLLTGGMLQIPLTCDVLSSWWDEIKDNEFLITTSGVAEGESEPRYQNKMLVDPYQYISPKRNIETIYFTADGSGKYEDAFKFDGKSTVVLISGNSCISADDDETTTDDGTDTDQALEDLRDLLQ